MNATTTATATQAKYINYLNKSVDNLSDSLMKLKEMYIVQPSSRGSANEFDELICENINRLTELLTLIKKARWYKDKKLQSTYLQIDYNYKYNKSQLLHYIKTREGQYIYSDIQIEYFNFKYLTDEFKSRAYYIKNVISLL